MICALTVLGCSKQIPTESASPAPEKVLDLVAITDGNTTWTAKGKPVPDDQASTILAEARGVTRSTSENTVDFVVSLRGSDNDAPDFYPWIEGRGAINDEGPAKLSIPGYVVHTFRGDFLKRLGQTPFAVNYSIGPYAELKNAPDSAESEQWSTKDLAAPGPHQSLVRVVPGRVGRHQEMILVGVQRDGKLVQPSGKPAGVGKTDFLFDVDRAAIEHFELKGRLIHEVRFGNVNIKAGAKKPQMKAGG